MYSCKEVFSCFLWVILTPYLLKCNVGGTRVHVTPTHVHVDPTSTWVDVQRYLTWTWVGPTSTWKTTSTWSGPVTWGGQFPNGGIDPQKRVLKEERRVHSPSFQKQSALCMWPTPSTAHGQGTDADKIWHSRTVWTLKNRMAGFLHEETLGSKELQLGDGGPDGHRDTGVIATAWELASPTPPRLMRRSMAQAKLEAVQDQEASPLGALQDAFDGFARDLQHMHVAFVRWAFQARMRLVPLSMAPLCADFARLGDAFDAWVACVQQVQNVKPPSPKLSAVAQRSVKMSPRKLRASPNRRRPEARTRNSSSLSSGSKIWSEEPAESPKANATSPSVSPRQGTATFEFRCRPPWTNGSSRWPSGAVAVSPTTPREPRHKYEATCMRADWPKPIQEFGIVTALQSHMTPHIASAQHSWPRVRTPGADIPYREWQSSLKSNAEAKKAARARDWAFRSFVLSNTRIMTPSRVVPWHIERGAVSHASKLLAARTAEIKATLGGDEVLGRELVGWPAFMTKRSVDFLL